MNIMPAVLIYATVSFVTVRFSLNQETREARFHSAFIYHFKSKEPLEAKDRDYFSGRPGFTRWEPLPSWLIHHNPSLPEAHRGRLYLDVLLGMVLQLLFTRYQSSWAVDFGVITLPHLKGTGMDWEPQVDAPASDFVKWDECEQWFPESGVFRAWVPPLVDRMAVPLKTTIRGEARYDGNKEPCGWSLHLKNPFVDITVGISPKVGTRGIGDLRKMIGYTVSHSEEYYAQAYAIRLHAKFERFRSGHPQMVWCRNWVADMFEALQEELDSRRHSERQKEHYTVFRREQSTPRDPQNMTQPTRG